MPHITRTSLATRVRGLLLALALLGLSATPALAAGAPANDTLASAKLVTLGFSESLDTTQATADADDAQLNADCGAPATDATVWYAIDGTGGGIKVDVSASNYSAGVIVAVGTPGSLTTLTCAPLSVAFRAEAGTRYYVLIFDDQGDGSGNGGALSIQFQQALVPDLDFSVNQYGSFDSRSGAATVRGSYTCSAGANFIIFVDGVQKVGRGAVTGFEVFEGVCDNTLHPWSVVLIPDFGKFAGGQLQVNAFGIAFGDDLNTEQEITQTVKLRAPKRK